MHARKLDYLSRQALRLAALAEREVKRFEEYRRTHPRPGKPKVQKTLFAGVGRGK